MATLAERWKMLLHAHPYLRTVLLFLYYVLVIVTLAFMYGRGDFSTPPFVYQEF
jgi:hypothetical protein